MDLNIINNLALNFNAKLNSTNPPLTLQEKQEKFYQFIKSVDESFQKAIECSLNKFGINVNMGDESFQATIPTYEKKEGLPVEKGETKFNVHTLSKDEQEQKKNDRNKLLKIMCSASIELADKADSFMKTHGEYDVTDKRNFRSLFAGHCPGDYDPKKKDLSPDHVLEELHKDYDTNKYYAKTNNRQKPTASKESIDLYYDYLDSVQRFFNKNVKLPKNNEELFDKISNIYHYSEAFSSDKVSDVLGDITGAKIPPEVDKKYKYYSNISQKYWGACFGLFNKITDPMFCMLKEEDANKISHILHSQHEYYEDSHDQQELVSVIDNETGIEAKINSPLFCLDSGNQFYADALEKKKDDEVSLEYMVKLDLDLKNDDNVFDIDGNKINKDSIHDHIFNNDMLFVVKGDNSFAKKISLDENRMLVYDDISKNKVDHKEDYQKMLDTLNSGTSLLNRSSVEYKNMRNLLTDLIKNPGENDLEKLIQIKENQKRYLENHEKKFFKSSTAMKRKACVDAITDTLNKCYLDERAHDIREKHLFTPEKARKNLIENFYNIEMELLHAGASKEEMQEFYTNKRKYGIVYDNSKKATIEQTKKFYQDEPPSLDEKIVARQKLIDLDNDLVRNIDNYEKINNAVGNYENQQNKLTQRLHNDLDKKQNNIVNEESKENEHIKKNIINMNNVSGK